MKIRTIAVVAGGTAGHVFPAQAISKILGTRNKILFFTDYRGKRFFGQDEEIIVLPIRNFQGKFVKKAISLFFLGIATLKALYVLRKEKVVMAIGFGGITSFPVLLAAKILKIPIILHEQNAVLGKANKFFLKDAEFLATSFEKTMGIDRYHKVIHTGNPIREVVFDAKRRRTRITSDIYITVIGGSQGATIFDTTIANAITLLPQDLQERINIFQQVRKENHDTVQSIYDTSKVRRLEMKDFFQNVPQLIADSDLVISRAGASTISEIEHLKIPSIIVPIASSKDNHQYHNAEYSSKKGTSKMITEQEFSSSKLAEIIEDLFNKNLIEDYRSKFNLSTTNSAAQKFSIKINEIIINMRI
jgi:UDP-N-acetylglucosamine--N-acetylmuramyl-(pentapeptide) pyrophosphoryl-undecaprenol N-acetylglucosamine transferase